MRDFGHDLDRALDAWIDKNCGSDIPGCPEETDGKIRNLLKQEERPMMKKRKPLTRWVGVIAACAVLMCSAAVVYAASPAVREYLNMLFLKEDSEARLTEVPEGYTGIYTAEDLDNVRNDLYGNYILMNDIVLTEADYREGGIFDGGFVPIGDEEHPFEGIFNGNGYAVSGLVIEGDYVYAGLFGCVKRQYRYGHEVNGEWQNHSVSSGMIKNLAVTDSVIRITADARIPWNKSSATLNVGAIAGKVDFVVGCYTENVEVYAHLRDNFAETGRDFSAKVCIGGVVGEAFIVDSCWSDGDVIFETAIDTAEVYAAGVAGVSFACVTSYFDGTVDSGDFPDYGVVGKNDYTVPVVLTQTILDKFGENYEMYRSESDADWEFEVRKLNAFYCEEQFVDSDIEAQYFMVTPVEEETLYFLDPAIMWRELKMLSGVIEKAFPNNTFNQFCMENNLKCGYYYCYDLREDPDCTFEGFDTESIWYIADGKPRLRLFSGGTRGLSTESIGDRPRLGWQKGLFQTPIPGM